MKIFKKNKYRIMSGFLKYSFGFILAFALILPVMVVNADTASIDITPSSTTAIIRYTCPVPGMPVRVTIKSNDNNTPIYNQITFDTAPMSGSMTGFTADGLYPNRTYTVIVEEKQDNYPTTNYEQVASKDFVTPAGNNSTSSPTNPTSSNTSTSSSTANSGSTNTSTSSPSYGEDITTTETTVPGSGSALVPTSTATPSASGSSTATPSVSGTSSATPSVSGTSSATPSVSGTNTSTVKISGGIDNPLPGINDIPSFIVAVINIVLIIAIPIITLAIIYTGFLFVQAQGNPAALEKAKNALVAVLIGAAIILGAFVISNAIKGTVDQIKSSNV